METILDISFSEKLYLSYCVRINKDLKFYFCVRMFCGCFGFFSQNLFERKEVTFYCFSWFPWHYSK